MEGTVSTPYLSVLLAAGRAAGVRVEDLLTIGISKVAQDPEGRVPFARADLLWDEIAQQSGDTCFSLHAAERMKPGSLAILEYAARNAPTLGEAFTRVERYGRLVQSGAKVGLRSQGAEVALTYSLPGLPSGSRHAAEFIVALWVVVGRQITEYDFNPNRVGFQHRATPEIAEHRRLFRCPVEFGRAENELVLERGLLARPVVKADPALCSLLDRYARDSAARIPKDKGLTSRARRLVAGALNGGDPSLEAVAQALRMSPRSLQRRLKDEGTSHQELLDELRQGLAEKYLREPSIAIGEAAFLLGFSEPSAFHRAFKRWTGTTPGEFRRAAGAG